MLHSMFWMLWFAAETVCCGLRMPLLQGSPGLCLEIMCGNETWSV